MSAAGVPQVQGPGRPYRFFFSYSWNNRSKPLARFFDNLAKKVRDLVGGPLEQVAFRDRVTMEAGTDWPDGLLEALKTSQVLIYLLSTDYIQSDYCGKELQIFLERVERFKAEHPQEKVPLFIQPVMWVSVDAKTLPKRIGRIQPEDNAFPTEYAARGLETLAKRKDKTLYNKVVDELARRIVAAANGDRLPRLEHQDNLNKVRNAFLDDEPIGRQVGPEGPTPEVQRETGVRCVYVAPKHSEAEELKIQVVKVAGKDRPLRTNYGDGGWDWQPYRPPVAMKIGSLVQQLTTDIPYREIQLQDEDQPDHTIDIDNVIRRLENAARNDQIILLVVDVWSAYLKYYQEFLVKFDNAIPMKSAVVVVPWNEGDSDTVELRETLERQLRDIFKSKYLGTQPFSPFFKPRVTTIEEFRTILTSVLKTIRDGIDTYRAAQRQIIEPGGPAPEVRSSRATSE